MLGVCDIIANVSSSVGKYIARSSRSLPIAYFHLDICIFMPSWVPYVGGTMLLMALYRIFRSGNSDYVDCDTRDASEASEVNDERCKFMSLVRIDDTRARKTWRRCRYNRKPATVHHTYNTSEREEKKMKKRNLTHPKSKTTKT